MLLELDGDEYVDIMPVTNTAPLRLLLSTKYFVFWIRIGLITDSVPACQVKTVQIRI